VTAAATHDLVNSYTIAHPHFRDGWAYSCDLSSDFMAEHKRRFGQRKIPLQDVNIGSTNTDRANANNDLAFAGDRSGTAIRVEVEMISSEPCQPAHPCLLPCGFADNS
jgi:hypothetical protein